MKQTMNVFYKNVSIVTQALKLITVLNAKKQMNQNVKHAKKIIYQIQQIINAYYNNAQQELIKLLTVLNVAQKILQSAFNVTKIIP